MWDRNSHHSICNKRRRVVEPFITSNVFYHLLLYWDFVDEMFTKPPWTQHLPRYWPGCFWNCWSPWNCCEYSTICIQINNNLHRQIHTAILVGVCNLVNIKGKLTTIYLFVQMQIILYMELFVSARV